MSAPCVQKWHQSTPSGQTCFRASTPLTDATLEDLFTTRIPYAAYLVSHPFLEPFPQCKALLGSHGNTGVAYSMIPCPLGFPDATYVSDGNAGLSLMNEALALNTGLVIMAGGEQPSESSKVHIRSTFSTNSLR